MHENWKYSNRVSAALREIKLYFTQSRKARKGPRKDSFWRHLPVVALILIFSIVSGSCSHESKDQYKFVSTVAGLGKEIGEPFGVAVRDGKAYVSDGQNGKIWLVDDGKATVFAVGMSTPSGLAIDKQGNLLVADSGANVVRSVDAKGVVSVIAGVEGRAGFADGDVKTALFNAPVGVAVGDDGKIYVADTYNDRIRLIENGQVTTLAGSINGFADGLGESTKFDTPCGVAVWQEKLLVADTGNRRIRVIEPTRRVWTLAGSGELDLKDGLLASSAFAEPTALAVDANGSIVVADGNAIRIIGGIIPTVRTLNDERRGAGDGVAFRSRFNRPSGLAFGKNGDLFVADSDNRLVRKFSFDRGHEMTADEIAALGDTPEAFRAAAPARWPYDPPTAKRDIAGTLGELRGDVKPGNDDLHFHNGLDIAGAYGETARFVRDEKVLQPLATSNFGTLRELIRMPTLGYIHIRVGRDSTERTFGDARFQFLRDANGKLSRMRVPRGTAFKAGDPIGTLNPMNHVHLIAGRPGFEMNALDALTLPGIADTRQPTIERVLLDQQDGVLSNRSDRKVLTGRAKIVMRAYDQIDGNSDRRRLGIYQAGYQLLRADQTPVGDINWTIKFDRPPPPAAIRYVYADGSHSGATGETIFDYIVTNHVEGNDFREDLFDPSGLANGDYVLRVFAADYFGNQAHSDLEFAVSK